MVKGTEKKPFAIQDRDVGYYTVDTALLDPQEGKDGADPTTTSTFTVDSLLATATKLGLTAESQKTLRKTIAPIFGNQQGPRQRPPHHRHRS
jgi:hypothetical protein